MEKDEPAWIYRICEDHLEAPLGLLSYSWSSLTHLVAGTAHSLPARAASISRAINGYRGPDISCVREDASSSYSTAQLPPASIEALKEWISFPLAPADCGCRDLGVVFRPRAPGWRHRSSPQASTPTHHLNFRQSQPGFSVAFFHLQLTISVLSYLVSLVTVMIVCLCKTSSNHTCKKFCP
uniref:Uncharacterized protein n=1 Tax=Triticum urartu TaxID=4572 RepID=A0A8R7UG67_TRIUA